MTTIRRSLELAVADLGGTITGTWSGSSIDVCPPDGMRAKDFANALRQRGFDAAAFCYDDDHDIRHWSVNVRWRCERARTLTEYEQRIVDTAARPEVASGQWALDCWADQCREVGRKPEAWITDQLARQTPRAYDYHTLAQAAGVDTGSAFTSAIRRLARSGDLDPRWVA